LYTYISKIKIILMSIEMLNPITSRRKLQTRTLAASPFLNSPIPMNLAFWLGVLAWLGGTSNAGFFVKKFLGLNDSVIGSAGMTGKSSGDGKCVIPKVCQRTISVLSIDSLPCSAIHAGRPCEGSPDVWGT